MDIMHEVLLDSNQVTAFLKVLTYNTERPPEKFYSAEGPLIPRPTSWGPEPEKEEN
jgi:hypothetical protein